MKNKALVLVLFIVFAVIFAVPIPFSLMSILGSIISLANIASVDSFLEAVLLITAMLIAGTYTISYIVSLMFTITKRKVNIFTFLPIIHLALIALIFLR